MVTYQVNDMTCGHCVSAITKAVASVDPGATVQADLESHRVQIEASTSSTEDLRDAISAAGYSPVGVPDSTAAGVSALPRKGCCCG